MRSTTSSKRSCDCANRRAIANSRSRPPCRSSPRSSPRRAVAADADLRSGAASDAQVTLRAVLWDLDGTLTDSVRFVVDTANRVIEAHGGVALDHQTIGGMTGLPLEAIFRMAWPDLTPDDAVRYRDEYRAIYDREIIPATRLFRGARSAEHT